MKNCLDEYQGFEVGDIRPPSESASLLIRITRNCPWNQCKFCGLYKGKKFSIRAKEHVFKDIDMIKSCIDTFVKIKKTNPQFTEKIMKDLISSLGAKGNGIYRMVSNWYKSDIKSIFLQDANSLIIKPNDMLDILEYIRKQLPDAERITSYARSHTVARISDEDLKRMADAGLNRIHIGMETASDKILELVKKGVDKKTHIKAGQKVKKAGIELSEYFMPGLGGNEYSKENALETADALNQVNPDFIRIRTLAVTDDSELYKDYEAGIFTRTNDETMVKELLLLIENLDGVTSIVKSDHILNLIPEVEGKLPEDKENMISTIKWFLGLDPEEKIIFRLGRRTGIMSGISELSNSEKRSRIESFIERKKITSDNIDAVTDELLKRFI